MADLIGFIATAFTTVAFIPQLLRAWQTKKTEDLSLLTLVILAIGLVLWLVYGLLANLKPIIFANTFTLVLVSATIVLKLRYDFSGRKTS